MLSATKQIQTQLQLELTLLTKILAQTPFKLSSALPIIWIPYPMSLFILWIWFYFPVFPPGKCCRYSQLATELSRRGFVCFVCTSIYISLSFCSQSHAEMCLFQPALPQHSQHHAAPVNQQRSVQTLLWQHFRGLWGNFCESVLALILSFRSPSELFSDIKWQLCIKDPHPPCSLRVLRGSEADDCFRNTYCLVLSDFLIHVFKYSWYFCFHLNLNILWSMSRRLA